MSHYCAQYARAVSGNASIPTVLLALVLAPWPTVATESEATVYASQLRLAYATGTSASGVSSATDAAHPIHFFPAASDALGRQGFARIVNPSDSAGTVSIVASDDGGRRHGPVALSLDARQTAHFNSADLEDGEASKGLPEGRGRRHRATDGWN